MRIGLLIYGSLETISGGYLYDHQLVNHLRQQGDEVEIISLPSSNYFRLLMDNFSMDLLARLRSLAVDILIQDELNHPSLFRLNHKLRKEVSYSLIAIVHHLRSSEDHPKWNTLFYRWVERQYLMSLDGFIYNSSTTRQVVESLIGKKISSVVAFPAGDRLCPDIDPHMIVHKAQESGPLRLLFLGNVIQRKGLHTLLAALVQIPLDLWSLTIAGSKGLDPGYTRRVEQLVKAYRLEDRVHFTGLLDSVAVKDVLHRNQILVIPSEYEGFGISYLEGMGFGLPAIATTSGGAGEIITHGIDGFLVPSADPNTLSSCIRQWIDDRDLLAKMSLAALERYERHPTWEQTTQQIRSFLVDFTN